MYRISVPQKGSLVITTEMGKMEVEPNEICVIQVNLYTHKVHLAWLTKICV